MRESKKIQAAFAAVFLVIALFIAKVIVTGVHHIALADAILLYQQDCLRDHREIRVNYDDKEDFQATLWRLWDWSNERILGEEDYIHIWQYIGEEVDPWIKSQNWS